MHFDFKTEDFSILLTENGDLFLKYLFDKYYKELCKLSFRYIGRSEIAEDIVQEVFINVWNTRFHLNYTGQIKPCLVRSVINTSINYVKSKYHRQHFEDENKVASFSGNAEYHGTYEIKELETLLEVAVSQLPDKCREIFVLSRLSGMSHKEIVDTLNISTKTIENQITIALKKIHHFLSQMGYLPLFFIFFK